MFPKAIAAIVFAVVVAVSLLQMRQQRLLLAHDLTQSLREMDQTRQVLWDLQCEIAMHTHPHTVHERIRKAGLRVEPVEPAQDQTQEPTDPSQFAGLIPIKPHAP